MGIACAWPLAWLPLTFFVASAQVLGKVNSAAVFSVIFTLANLTYAVVDTWRSVNPTVWWVHVGSIASNLVMQIFLWEFTMATLLGQGVTYAHNGHKVLRMMATAAAGVRRPRTRAESLSQTLPWLSAFDRRDCITIKMVLDDVERIVREEEEEEEEVKREAARLAALLRAQSTESTSEQTTRPTRADEEPRRKERDTHLSNSRARSHSAKSLTEKQPLLMKSATGRKKSAAVQGIESLAAPLGRGLQRAHDSTIVRRFNSAVSYFNWPEGSTEEDRVWRQTCACQRHSANATVPMRQCPRDSASPTPPPRLSHASPTPHPREWPLIHPRAPTSPCCRHCTALSAFVHARLIPSVGDAPEGHSVRTWLAEAGVTLFEGAQVIWPLISPERLRSPNSDLPLIGPWPACSRARSARSLRRKTPCRCAPPNTASGSTSRCRPARKSPPTGPTPPSMRRHTARSAAARRDSRRRRHGHGRPCRLQAVRDTRASRRPPALAPEAKLARSSPAKLARPLRVPPSRTTSSTSSSSASSSGARASVAASVAALARVVAIATALNAALTERVPRWAWRLPRGGHRLASPTAATSSPATIYGGTWGTGRRLSACPRFALLRARVRARRPSPRRYRWRFVRGVDDFVETPVGRFALVRGSEATGAGKRHPLRLDISTKLMTIKLKIWSLVFFYGTAVHNILQTVEVVNNQEDMSHALFPEDNAFWIPYLTNDLVLTLGYIFYLGALGILLYRKVYNDWLHWPRMPMPLRCTGKIEYALFWACYISIQWMVIARGKCMLSQECPGLLHTQSFVNNSNLSEASLIDNVVAVDEPIYLVLAVNSCFLIVAFALSLYEGLIAVVNACVGAYRYRHPGYLSEIWERSFLQEGHELR